MTAIPPEAIPPEMVEAAHEAEILTGSPYGRLRRIIAAVWPLIAAAERERIRQLVSPCVAGHRPHVTVNYPAPGICVSDRERWPCDVGEIARILEVQPTEEAGE